MPCRRTLPENRSHALRARRMLTMAGDGPGLIDDAVLISRAGRIERVLPYKDALRLWSASELILEETDATVAPGLINAHCHLELSHCADTVQGQGFAAWVRSMIAQPMDRAEPEAMARAAASMRAAGIAHVADITGRRPDLAARALREAGLSFHLCLEAFGFFPPAFPEGGPLGLPPHAPPGAKRLASLAKADQASVAMAGHALYSTAPETLQEAHAWSAERGLPFSLHLAEHEGEGEMLATGTGDFFELMTGRGVTPRDFAAPGRSPVAQADALGLLDARTLAVHCVHLSNADIATLAERGANVCLCPRSNQYIGVGEARIDDLAEAGVNCCLGTDGLTSNHDLDLWNEAIFCLENTASHSSVRQLVEWMTTAPAKALGLERELGSLSPGKRAEVSIVPDALAGLL